MTRTYQHILPDLHPVHTKYIVPLSTAIQVTYKPNSETLSDQARRPISGRPRDQVRYSSRPPSVQHKHLTNFTGYCLQS